jgi:hypothetical protein
MRRLRRVVFALFALCGAGAAGQYAVSQSYNVAALRSETPADRALLTFREHNPDCALWSDWQRLCSRMGPSGSVTCKTDPFRKVARSAPFCVSGRPKIGSQAEVASRDRFCVGRDPNVPKSPFGGTCAVWANNRPFSGRAIAHYLHPACEIWGYESALKGDLCTTGTPRPNLPSCSSPKMKSFRTTEILACTKWQPWTPCKLPVGGTLARAKPREDEIAISVRTVPNNQTPTVGVLCADWANVYLT